MDLGKAIYRLRKEKNIKQGKFATDIGISQSFASQIENGRKIPELKTLEKISDYFNMPLPFLTWMSIEVSDISDEKQHAYQMLKSSVDALIQDVRELRDKQLK